jgi:hypothetical protein
LKSLRSRSIGVDAHFLGWDAGRKRTWPNGSCSPSDSHKAIFCCEVAVVLTSILLNKKIGISDEALYSGNKP